MRRPIKGVHTDATAGGNAVVVPATACLEWRRCWLWSRLPAHPWCGSSTCPRPPCGSTTTRYRGAHPRRPRPPRQLTSAGYAMLIVVAAITTLAFGQKLIRTLIPRLTAAYTQPSGRRRAPGSRAVFSRSALQISVLAPMTAGPQDAKVDACRPPRPAASCSSVRVRGGGAIHPRE